MKTIKTKFKFKKVISWVLTLSMVLSLMTCITTPLVVFAESAAPTLTAATTNNALGQLINLTFTDDAAWRSAITGVTVNGKAIDSSKYSILLGKITINGSAFAARGVYTVAVQATGYNDVTVTQTIKSAPTLRADTTDNMPSHVIEMSFMKNGCTTWPSSITGITVNGNAIDKSKYVISTSRITIDGSVFTAAGDYAVAVQATDYSDVTATQTIKASVAATEFTVNIVKNEQTTLVHKYTIEEMKALQTTNSVYYTSIESVFGSKVVSTKAPVSTKAQGVLVSKLLENAQKYNSYVGYYDSFKIYTTGESDLYSIPSKSYLYNTPRYYFPNLVSTWHGVNNKPGNGATEGAVAVEPMFAITSYQGRNLIQGDLDKQTMDGNSTFRFCIGQKLDDIENGNTNTEDFAECVNRIDIYLPFAPIMKAATTNNTVDNPINLTFTDDEAWRGSVTGVTVNGNAIDKSKYTVAQGKITIDGSIFTKTGDYAVAVQATGYNDGMTTQTINAPVEPLAPVTLMAASTNNTVGKSIDLTFTDDEAWRNAVTGVTVNGSTIDKSKYTIAAGKITIDSSIFTAVGDYKVTVQATGYSDSTVTQTIVNGTVKNGLYTITPVKDDAYQIGTDSGISTFTVKNGVSGFRYFTANITPVNAHDGTETVVFAKYSNGVLMNMNATVADFDTVSSAQAGFNVKEGDIVKVYIVDKFTNDTSINPIILQ